MTGFRAALSTLLALSLGLSLSAAETVDPAWEKLRTLVGDWKGTYEGKSARVSYRLVSGGTALLETLLGGDATEMITVYHPDGTSLLMVHYCAMGNQPRMRSKGLQDGRLDFLYVDATNLKSPDQPRMSRLVLSFPDPEHLVQEWTWSEGGQEQVGRFEFRRAR